MCEKDFIRPFIKKVLVGNEERAIEVNEAVAKASTFSKKRKKPSLSCDYCDKRFTSIRELRKHVVSEHIVALDSAKLQTTISPSSSPPTKGPKLGCVQCGRHFKNIKELDVHVKNHAKWKLNIVKTPNPIRNQDADSEKLMCNDAGIEAEPKDFLEEATNTESSDPQVPRIFGFRPPGRVVEPLRRRQPTSYRLLNTRE